MFDVGELQKTVSLLIERIEDFLSFSGDLKSLPPGSYPEDEYLRLLVPINAPIERLHLEFEICRTETASTSALLLGEEGDSARAIALLKNTLEQYWPLPCVAGERGGVIYSRFSKELLVDRFSAMQPRLIRVRNLLSDTDPWSSGRMKRQWLDENPAILEKQFEAIRTKNPDRVRDAGGGGRGPWQFKKSLCHEFGLKCPELPQRSP